MRLQLRSNSTVYIQRLWCSSITQQTALYNTSFSHTILTNTSPILFLLLPSNILLLVCSYLRVGVIIPGYCESNLLCHLSHWNSKSLPCMDKQEKYGICSLSLSLSLSLSPPPPSSHTRTHTHTHKHTHTFTHTYSHTYTHEHHGIYHINWSHTHVHSTAYKILN